MDQFERFIEHNQLHEMTPASRDSLRALSFLARVLRANELVEDYGLIRVRHLVRSVEADASAEYEAHLTEAVLAWQQAISEAKPPLSDGEPNEIELQIAALLVGYNALLIELCLLRDALDELAAIHPDLVADLRSLLFPPFLVSGN